MSENVEESSRTGACAHSAKKAASAIKSLQNQDKLSILLENAGLRAKAVSALEEGLAATKTYWDGVAKQMRIEPDWKTRAAVAVDILSFTDGRPVERKEIVTFAIDSLDEMQKRIQQSPAAQSAIRRLLKPVGIQNDPPPEAPAMDSV